MTARLRVLYMMPQPLRAGVLAAYTFLDEEVHALAASGIDPFVLLTTAPESSLEGRVHVEALPPDSWRTRGRTLTFAGVTATSWPRRNLPHVRRLYHGLRIEGHVADLVRRHRIDLIHSHFAWPYGLGGVVAHAAAGRPLVASLRGTDILQDDSIAYGKRGDRFFARNLNLLLTRATRTVYFSEFMREQGVSLGAPRERSRVIRKGVDLERFYVASDRAALKRELGLPDRPFILTVAGLIRRKGVHVVLDALARLRDTETFTFGICGEGPERANLEAQARELGLGERLRFFGKVPRATIAHYFAAADIFVLASSLEAAGNVLFESMAAARPIVTTAAGGPGEYVVDGETGYVVPVNDPDAMAARLSMLLRDPALADRLGTEGRRRTLSEFSYPRMIDDIKRVYQEAVEEPLR